MTSTSVKVIWADFGSISTRLTRNLLIFNPCAQDETRTHTTLLPLPPQSSVYTNFTTCAFRFLAFVAASTCDYVKNIFGAQNRTRTCTPRGIRT